ncbi:MAG: hypothetical protein EBZ77_03680 [Chitinophagia bacterium]|nr:hypothetical protein [Chitinophagia bacterium]
MEQTNKAFYGITFEEYQIFPAKSGDYLIFHKCVFSELVAFEANAFKKIVFKHCIFKGPAIFDGCVFQRLDLLDCKLHNDLHIKNSRVNFVTMLYNDFMDNKMELANNTIDNLVDLRTGCNKEALA